MDRISLCCLFLCLICAVVRAQDPYKQAKSDEVEWSNFLSFLKLAGAATLGAFVLYILYRHQNRQPFSLLLALNVKVDNSAHSAIVLSDMMILSSIIGGGSVTLLTAPVTASQALAAGLGMTGIFSAHLRELNSRKKK